MSTPASPKPIDAVATIANGASLSGIIDLGGASLVGIQTPSAWTAANLTFQASFDGTTFCDLYDSATERNITAAASLYLATPIASWRGIRYLKVRSGTSGTPVNQGAARSIKLILQP